MKKMYPSREIAEDALIEARIKFNYGASGGPVGIYLCEDCGHYHLTSKGSMNEKLAQYMAEGKLQRMKEAELWAKKLKKG
jgi:hypothetical protein